jgi:hypothetical protein
VRPNSANEAQMEAKNTKNEAIKHLSTSFSMIFRNSSQIIGREYQTNISCGTFDAFLGHDVIEARLSFNCSVWVLCNGLPSAVEVLVLCDAFLVGFNIVNILIALDDLSVLDRSSA